MWASSCGKKMKGDKCKFKEKGKFTKNNILNLIGIKVIPSIIINKLYGEY